MAVPPLRDHPRRVDDDDHVELQPLGLLAGEQDDAGAQVVVGRRQHGARTPARSAARRGVTTASRPSPSRSTWSATTWATRPIVDRHRHRRLPSRTEVGGDDGKPAAASIAPAAP